MTISVYMKHLEELNIDPFLMVIILVMQKQKIAMRYYVVTNDVFRVTSDLAHQL